MLSNEVKNLGCSLGKTGPIDKKVERQIKQDLLAQFQKGLDEGLANFDCDQALSQAVYFLCTLQGCHLGLHKVRKDHQQTWALTICAQSLTNKDDVLALLQAKDKAADVNEFADKVRELIK